jgi:hypothetical protein
MCRIFLRSTRPFRSGLVYAAPPALDLLCRARFAYRVPGGVATWCQSFRATLRSGFLDRLANHCNEFAGNNTNSGTGGI